MQGLIGDLLDAGRIDAGTLSVDPEPLEVAALVEQARTTFLSGGGRQAMRIDLPPDLPRVMADERRIVQVLNNLFSNAARHSPESSPIEVSAVRDGIEVAVSVTDEGRGVAPEQLPHLFRRYADAGGGERGAAGFGLGLVICKGLVEAHGGRIRAESAGLGLGTRVTFTLPVAEEAVVASTASGMFASGSRSPGEGREPVPVLVVDDDPATLRHGRDALAGAGYVPLVTGEPEEAVRLVRTKRPRLVLLDLMLPRTDGIALMQSVPEMASPAGHLHLRLRPRRDHRAGARGGGRRLPRQALLGGTAHGAGRRRPSPPRGRRALRPRRARHRLRAAPGERGREPGRAHVYFNTNGVGDPICGYSANWTCAASTGTSRRSVAEGRGCGPRACRRPAR